MTFSKFEFFCLLIAANLFGHAIYDLVKSCLAVYLALSAPSAPPRETGSEDSE